MLQTKKQPLNLCTWQPIIDLGHGYRCLLDPADYHRLKHHRWFAKKSNSCLYAVRKVRRAGHETIIRMHREIVAAPPGHPVHHINHNTLDNRRANLFICTPSTHSHLHTDPLTQK